MLVFKSVRTKIKKTPHTKINGFTLIELIVGIAVLGIVSAIALPNLSTFIIGMRVDNEISAIHRLVLTARNTSINMGLNVTLCPLESGVCVNKWQNELTLFIDINNNGKYEPTGTPADTIIRVKDKVKANDKLLYPYTRLAYEPTGQAVRSASGGTAGMYRYCPYGDASLARAVEVSALGRAYLSSDINRDGQDQTRNGSAISCP